MEHVALNERPTSRRRKSINFRVHALESSLFKGAQQFFGSRFGVGVPEMRILSNLDSEGELAANQLVALTAMDKGLVSRILNALLKRKLLLASESPTDARRRSWTLSRNGRALVEQLRPLWKQREAMIQDGLSPQEHEVLEELLERLFIASEKLRNEEAAALQLQSRRARRKSAVQVHARQPEAAE